MGLCRASLMAGRAGSVLHAGEVSLGSRKLMLYLSKLVSLVLKGFRCPSIENASSFY